MRDGGGEPHWFHFEVRVQGARDDWTGDPFKLSVQAWSLSEACEKAARVRLPQWTLPPEEDA